MVYILGELQHEQHLYRMDSNKEFVYAGKKGDENMKLNQVIPQLKKEVEVEEDYEPMYAMLHGEDDPE